MKAPLPERLPKVIVLSTPQHFLGKLYWEIEQFCKAEIPQQAIGAHLIASYHAANCAITAWHMTDWIWEFLGVDEREDLTKSLVLKSTKLEAFQDYVRTQCRALHFCYELAIGAKHRNPQSKKMEDLVSARDVWKAKPLTCNSKVNEPLVRYAFELVVDDAGRTVPLREVFRCAFFFWESLLSDVGLIEHRLVQEDEEHKQWMPHSV
jgi:hypothetical protein